MWKLCLAQSVACVLFAVGCDGPQLTRSAPNIPDALSEETQAVVRKFCGDCHALPDANTFPKSHWEREVEQGFQFYIDSRRTDLAEPLRSETVRFFRDSAPESILLPDVESFGSSHQFIKSEPFVASTTDKMPSCISHLEWDQQDGSLLLSDMRAGTVTQVFPNQGWEYQELAKVENSCRVSHFDWNDDGIRDFLICDIGSFAVGDHQNGKLLLLLSSAAGFQKLQLAEGLGRIVEAQAIDYDEDGDLDILVAEFGWRATGSVKLLRNPGGDLSTLKFAVEVLDSRHGALGVKVADLNHDGRNDYLIAFGQEFETLEAYYGEGNGAYRKSILIQLPDPSYNSSSFGIVDIDQDGRLDIIHTNGDSMDAFLPKPYHGVRWLRNLGSEQWETRELGLLVGALQSCAADFDGDGDVDIAAVGMLPDSPGVVTGVYDSVVWWEQEKDLAFKRHALEQYGPSYAACTTGDVNRDGLPDLIVGQWLTGGPGKPVALFSSRTPPQAGAPSK